MDKCEDSLRTEKELNKIIASPEKEKNFKEEPFSPEKEYKLNEVENEIESFDNISDIKKENNNEHFFIEDNINNKKEVNTIKTENKNLNKNISRFKALSNFLSMDNEHYELFKKNIQKNKKNNNTRNISRTNNFNSCSIGKQNSKINRVSYDSLPKYYKKKNYILESKSIFNTGRYKNTYKGLFSNNIKTNNDSNILLSNLSHKNLNVYRLINSNYHTNNKINLFNKINDSIIHSYSNRNFNDKNNSLRQRLNRLDNKLKNNSNNIFEIENYDIIKNNFIEINDINHLKLEEKIYNNNRKNDIYTLNEISKNFDKIFNMIENKVKSKKTTSYNNMVFKNINNKNSSSSLTRMNYIKKKFLTQKSTLNNYTSKTSSVNYRKNEYEKSSKSKINDVMKLKNKYLFKTNFFSSRIESESERSKRSNLIIQHK